MARKTQKSGGGAGVKPAPSTSAVTITAKRVTGDDQIRFVKDQTVTVGTPGMSADTAKLLVDNGQAVSSGQSKAPPVPEDETPQDDD